jgi:formate hydrogenlyase subunit 3/multisubunit Na+/H+ antiporter MnhD subunit
MNTTEYAAAWLVGSVAYGTAALYTARWSYGRMRAIRIDYRARANPFSKIKPVAWFDKFDRVPFLMICMFCGLAWPWTMAMFVLIRALTGVTMRVVGFLESAPVKSEFEKEQEKRDATES